jgi:hypothetical protein
MKALVAVGGLLLGLLAIGCSQDPNIGCENGDVDECLAKDVSCPRGQELFCNYDEGAICDCREGSGGSGGSGGAGGMGGGIACQNPTIADADISSGQPDTPLGTFGFVDLFSPAVGGADKGYLIFDTSSLPQQFSTVELTLTLNANYSSAASPTPVNVYGIIDPTADWNVSALPESDITWNSAPMNDTTSPTDFLEQGQDDAHRVRLLGSYTASPTDEVGTRYRIVITDFVRWAMGENQGFSAFAQSDSDGYITILLGLSQADTGDHHSIKSRDFSTGCDRPHLEAF